MSVSKLLKSAARHLEANRLIEAERAYRLALIAQPGNATANFGLGTVAARMGNPAGAIPHFVEALRAAPDEPSHWTALAAALIACDRVSEAGAILTNFCSQGFSKAFVRRLTAPIAGTLLTQASVLLTNGAIADAETVLNILVAVDDTNAAAIHLAGVVAGRKQEHENAGMLFEIATRLDDQNASYLFDLGLARLNCGRKADALGLFQRVVILDPKHCKAYVELAKLERQRGRLRDALASMKMVTRLDSDASHIWSDIGVLLHECGQTAEAIEVFEEAVRKNPGNAFVHSNLAQAVLFSEREDASLIAKEYGIRHANHLSRRRPFANLSDRDRPLRIGFVSADLRDHPVARFIEPFLQFYDRAQFETFAYAAGDRDATTERLQAYVTMWRNISSLEDEAVADLIERDRMDLLVDLSGHTASHRLLVFARKPAPVQVTWIGLPTTTGLLAMDYRLTDAFYDPEGTSDPLATETLWRLPCMAYCYRPDVAMPDPAPCTPRDKNGYVTFACFNRFEKVSDGTLAAWAKIMALVPDARLLLVVANIADPETRAWVMQRLQGAGIDADRVDFEPRSAQNKYALYHRADIALDPFPFNGGTTSYDTLYMGVPIVALRGSRTISRMGAAILSALGLSDLIADSVADYVAIACRLASDPQELTRVRHGLRERMLASPHMDHRGHAEEVGKAFKAMWEEFSAVNYPIYQKHNSF